MDKTVIIIIAAVLFIAVCVFGALLRMIHILSKQTFDLDTKFDETTEKEINDQLYNDKFS